MISTGIGCLGCLFENDVVSAFEAETITDGKTGLAGSNDDGFDFFHLRPRCVGFKRLEERREAGLGQFLMREVNSWRDLRTGRRRVSIQGPCDGYHRQRLLLWKTMLSAKEN